MNFDSSTGINCKVEDAVKQMELVKTLYGKEDGILALDYEIKHSYTQKEFHQYLSSMGYSYYYRTNKLCIRREPYKRTTLKFYRKKSIFKKAYKPKGIIALYYYYRFLLGLYPKHNMQHKLTPEMRKEIKKMDKYSETIRFLCKYKIETIEDVDNVKEKKLREKQDILNTRNRLYYKRGKVDNETAKNEMTKQIIAVTAELKRVKKEIRMCDEVTDNVPSMKEQVRETEEKLKEKQKQKDRKYER